MTNIKNLKFDIATIAAVILIIVSIVVWLVRIESQINIQILETNTLREKLRTELEAKHTENRIINQKLDSISGQLNELQGYLKGKGIKVNDKRFNIYPYVNNRSI